MADKNPDEVRKEIEDSRYYLGTVDDFGLGHLNVHGSIMFAHKEGTTYNGQPLPPDFSSRVRDLHEEMMSLLESADRATGEVDVDDLLMRTEASGLALPYHVNLVGNSVSSGFLSRDKYIAHIAKRDSLFEEEGGFRERFLEHGRKERKLHEDYIAFLKASI